MARPARLEQITIALPPELWTFVSNLAERESRTVAGQIRHFVAEAARRNGASEHLTPLPVREQIRTAEDLSRRKGDLSALEHEREQLKVKERKLGIRFMPADADRLRYLNDEIYTLGKEVQLAERMQGAAA
jgi:hypothetical protein